MSEFNTRGVDVEMNDAIDIENDENGNSSIHTSEVINSEVDEAINDNVVTLAEPMSRWSSSITLTKYLEENIDAVEHGYSVLAGLYAITLIIFAFSLEILSVQVNIRWTAPIIFATCMHCVAIAYFLFSNLFIIYPQWWNYSLSILVDYCKLDPKIQEKLELEKASHTGEGCGSFYLRCGTVFFGTFAIVFFGLELYMSTKEKLYQSHLIYNEVLSIIFVCFQTHYIFCNSKVSFDKFRWVAQFGVAHCLAVNLWNWWRFVLAKQGGNSTASLLKHMIKNVKYLNKNVSIEQIKNSSIEIISSESSESMEDMFLEHNAVLTFSKQQPYLPEAFNSESTYDLFYDLSTILITCVVEYSIIGAAIFFVTWKEFEHTDRDAPYKAKRKSHIKIDCSNSFFGLFTGIAFLSACLTSIAIYYVYFSFSSPQEANRIFRITALCLFSVITIFTIYGIFTMRKLSYDFHGKSIAGSLDDILLIVGLLGELIYSSMGFILSTTTQGHDRNYSGVMIATFVLRIGQSLLQSLYIFLACRLKMKSAEAKMTRPGKQMITTLLISNIGLFFYSTLEGTKTMFTESAIFDIPTFTSILYAVSPLVVFFRFHSSVYFAEVWKHCYSTKSHHGGSTAIHSRATTISRRVSYAHDVL